MCGRGQYRGRQADVMHSMRRNTLTLLRPTSFFDRDDRVCALSAEFEPSAGVTQVLTAKG